MNKKGDFFSALFVLILLVAIGYGGYYLYQNFPRDTIQLITQDKIEIRVNNTLPSKQFYENMRYADKIISYHISSSCPESKSSKMIEAIKTLESKTILVFRESSNAEINILCSDVSPQAEEKNHFVAGEGGPSRVLNTTLYSVILEGKVALYREGNCNNANVATHELLHALGFDHNNNPKSILYPTLKCDQEIDSEIINSINELYSVSSLPDLLFDKINATKSGRYLNFHFEVLNRGLKEAKSVNVNLYADDELMESFDLKEISIGSKKIIDVQNLKVPLNSKTIEFVIDYENQISEIYENNNRVILNAIN